MKTVIFTLGLIFSQIFIAHWGLSLTEKVTTIVAFVFFFAVILDFTELIFKGIRSFNIKGKES